MTTTTTRRIPYTAAELNERLARQQAVYAQQQAVYAQLQTVYANERHARMQSDLARARVVYAQEQAVYAQQLVELNERLSRQQEEVLMLVD